MSVQPVTSAANTTLKRLRSLREKKYRRVENLFLAEGLRICTEALDAGWTPRILVHATNHGDHPLVRRLARATLAEGGQVLETPPELLSAITGKDNPQSVAAAYRPRTLALDTLSPGPRTLVCERLRDPGNLGTLLRACDATATGALVLLDESTDPTSPEAVRASMGAFFTVPTVHATSTDFLAWKARHGATLTAAALDPSATDYRATSYPGPNLLLIGNEAQGLPETLLSAADRLVAMPMRGRADSLNAAMAGTLLLYEAMHWQEGQAG
jgi:TrmH family RNA methyltransferase